MGTTESLLGLLFSKVRTMAINTWQDAIGTYATVRGYPGVVLQIKHIHGDVMSNDWILHRWNDPNGTWGQPATCVCEIVEGGAPEAWGEPCTPFGHYRVAAVDLILEGENDV